VDELNVDVEVGAEEVFSKLNCIAVDSLYGTGSGESSRDFELESAIFNLLADPSSQTFT
jgi:hypothetical protein